MSRPIFVWRLDDLEDKRTIRTSESGAELKIEDLSYRLWLHYGMVTEEERDNGTWVQVNRYPAKTS